MWNLDSIIINAGIGFYEGIMEINEIDINKMIEVNFTGIVWSVQAAVPEFRKQGFGDIIIIASVAGLQGGSNEAVYAGTNNEFTIDLGRAKGDPTLENYLSPDDVALQTVITL